MIYIYIHMYIFFHHDMYIIYIYHIYIYIHIDNTVYNCLQQLPYPMSGPKKSRFPGFFRSPGVARSSADFAKSAGPRTILPWTTCALDLWDPEWWRFHGFNKGLPINNG